MSAIRTDGNGGSADYLEAREVTRTLGRGQRLLLPVGCPKRRRRLAGQGGAVGPPTPCQYRGVGLARARDSYFT